VGLLQPHVRHRGRDREARLSGDAKAITVHTLRQAKAAAAAAAQTGIPVLLLSAYGAAGGVGPAWFAAVIDAAKAAYPEASLEGLLDCAGTPGYALAALRQGLKRIRYDGPAYDAIADIAAQGGATVRRERPTALDLATLPDADGPEAMAALIAGCSRWLLA
jgi:hypothetical protein